MSDRSRPPVTIPRAYNNVRRVGCRSKRRPAVAGAWTLPGQTKKKNNHFVPQTYLRRFCSVSERQVGLYNLKSGRAVETAPIKSQCARDYFYTKNPIFEDRFSEIEGLHKRLFSNVIENEQVPPPGSPERSELSIAIMFQAGRTISEVERINHIYNEFGKAILRNRFHGQARMLNYLSQVKIEPQDAVIDAIGQHIAMYPLIDDLDCTLFINHTEEDFVTSDHPIAMCNSMPPSSPHGANLGFASRGLIILFPMTPRALLFLSDREVYKIEKSSSNVAVLADRRDAVELNIAQCFNAHENLYFASSARVQGTLEAFNKRRDTLRKARPAVTKTPMIAEGRQRLLLQMPEQPRRLALPKAVKIRYAAKKVKYQIGDSFVRDYARTTAVEIELRRLEKLREEAMRKAGE